MKSDYFNCPVCMQTIHKKFLKYKINEIAYAYGIDPGKIKKILKIKTGEIINRLQFLRLMNELGFIYNNGAFIKYDSRLR